MQFVFSRKSQSSLKGEKNWDQRWKVAHTAVLRISALEKNDNGKKKVNKLMKLELQIAKFKMSRVSEKKKKIAQA